MSAYVHRFNIQSTYSSPICVSDIGDKPIKSKNELAHAISAIISAIIIIVVKILFFQVGTRLQIFEPAACCRHSAVCEEHQRLEKCFSQTSTTKLY